MTNISEELLQKLFDLARFYSGAEYVLAELEANPSFNASKNGAFVKENAPKVISLLSSVLENIGYSIKAYSPSPDGSPKIYQNEAREMGGILREGAGYIGFIHANKNLCMSVGEQARFVSDRFLPDSWSYLIAEINVLCSDPEIASLRKRS